MHDSSKSLYMQAVVSNQFPKEENYWKTKFEGEWTKCVFPYDRKKVQNTYTMASIGFKFDGEIFSKLMKLSNDSDYRLYMIMTAVLVVLINKYTGDKDVIIGTPTIKQDYDAEFINTVLALRNNIDQEGMTFKDLLLQVRQTIIDANENQNYPLERLLYQLGLNISPGEDFPLFDITVEVENIHDKKYLQRIHYNILFSFFRNPDTLNGVVEYNSILYDKESIERIVSHYSQVLIEILTDVNIKIIDIDILTQQEKNQILFGFNSTEAAYPTNKTIHELFEEQVTRMPDNTSVVDTDGSTTITYLELNQKANRLARLLRSKGVKQDTIVGIMVERSIDMIVGLLGILKAGGAYLPIDKNYPAKRVQYILEDSWVRILITDGRPDNEVTLKEIIRLDEIELDEFEKNNLNNISYSSNLVYVIYTSGSTGYPKGVLIRHRGLCNLIQVRKRIFGENPGFRISQVASPGFDAMAPEVWPCLLQGASLYIVDAQTRMDSFNMKKWLIKFKITLSYQPTVIAILLLQEEWLGAIVSLKFLLTAGDRLTQYSKPRFPFRFYNLYGPTEDTVWTTWSEIGFSSERNNLPPIGKPIDNHKVYIVDSTFKLQPIGVPGEILIMGDGLALGYLNNPELTAKKFVRSPFFSITSGHQWAKDALGYCTGDIGHWLPDGNLEFLGRIDHQVKIKGFRIELGEIENKILKHNKVKEVVVASKENESGDKYLCAYIVFKGKNEKIAADGGLREYLAMELPDYMIPSYFVSIEKIPLTSNGKFDIRALPDPWEIHLKNSPDCILPRDALERDLVEIWQKVLGRKQIGINDNLFSIGGDSIKSIQILSRMNQAGYKIEMRELFQYPTISGLAPRVKKFENTSEQLPISGKIPLTPVQEWFFKTHQIDIHHFNQSVMFYSKNGFEEGAINTVFTKIQAHHDVLRMTYKEENGGIMQINHGLDYPLSLMVFDFRNQQNSLEALEAKANELQASIDLEKGPLMKLGLFHLDDGDRLLIVIHHLVIDAVSWRILFEDIETLYRQYKKGDQLTLPLKTDSFKVWAEKLYDYANSETFLKEKAYWVDLESTKLSAIEKDFNEPDNFRKDAAVLSFILDEQETDNLLTKVNNAFGTEINDILLTALGMGIQKTWGHNGVLVSLEGHGREEIMESVDISRTVGWFTSTYPLVLKLSDESNLGRQIKGVKEAIRKIPHKGIGYDILKYLTREEQKKDVEFKLKPQFGFNYLGQFDADFGQISFEIAKESAGNAMSRNGERELDFDIAGMIANNRLQISITYNRNHYKPDTMKVLLDNIRNQLKNIIAFCCSKENTERTPSDFTYKGLSIETIDRLMKEYPGIEDIYTLTPMQEGMLFHALVDEKSYSYFEQTSYRLQGELDIKLLAKSLNELFKRHDILRTAFVYQDIERTVQVVLKDRTVDFYYKAINKTGELEEKESFVRNFKVKDKERGFDLAKESLMRVSIIELEQFEYEFIWSFHHILIDGWCMGILIADFFEIYNSYLENRPHRLVALKPYRTYIQWLESQDKERSAGYWEKYLYAYEEAASVPKTKVIKKKKNESVYINKNVSVVFDREKTASLNNLAAVNQVTLNTVTQVLWGILLGQYNGKEDVVFGAVVSGRPTGLEGVESMVGLFINTIPVRIRFEERMKFHELLQIVQENAIASEPHHYHPLAEIQAMSPLKQNLIDHLFIYENYPVSEQIEGYGREKNESNKISFKLTNVEVFEQTNYDFNVVLGGADRLKIMFNYNGNVYERKYVERVAAHFLAVIGQVIEKEELEIRELELLSVEEKSWLLNDFNDTQMEYPKDKTLHELFVEQVERTPDSIAVIYSSMHITYRDLNDRAEWLASVLQERGVTADTIVGIKVERSIEMITGILGILKSGVAYMPIDPEYPKERIDYMLKDSGAKVLVTTDNIAKEDEKVRRWEGEKVLLEEIPESLKNSTYPLTLLPSYLQSPSNLAGHRPPAISLAYII